MARPRRTLPPGAKRYILDQARTGLSETRIAEGLGLDYKSWKRILEDDPEAKEVWDQALAIERDRLVEKLHELATDGNLNALRLMLASRHGIHESNATGESAGDQAKININLPSSLTANEYQRIMGGHAQLEPDPVEGEGGE